MAKNRPQGKSTCRLCKSGVITLLLAHNRQKSVCLKNLRLAVCYPEGQQLFAMEEVQGIDVSCCSFQGSSTSLQLTAFVQNAVTMSAVIASVMPYNKTNVTGDGVSISEIA